MSMRLIQKLYQDNKDLSAYLAGKGEISFQSQLDDNFKKVLLLAAASSLERQVTEILIDFASKASNNCTPLISFVQNKAIHRKYHEFFDWKNRSANSFFGLFGTDLKQRMISEVSAQDDLDKGKKAFLEIGDLRNNMVHEDYVSFPLDKTADEVFQMYLLSQTFVTYLSNTLLNSVPKT